MDVKRPLKIVSASAGSGKTFSLVQAYLKLTLDPKRDNSYFSSVIAMTFTNKASMEMKERIMEALDMLAYPDRSNPKEQKKAADLLRTTEKNLGFPGEVIRENAQHVLSAILHSYGEFKVQTIDKFSLQLIRTFSRDLNVNDDFEVVLKVDEIIERVVDQLLSKIGSPEHEEVTKLALLYAKSNLEEGDKWNFRSSLIDFAKVLTKENNQDYVLSILKQSFTKELYQQVNQDYQRALFLFQQERDELYASFLNYNLESKDMPQGNRGLYGYLSKLPQMEKPNRKVNSYITGTLDGSIVKDKHTIPPELVTKTYKFLSYIEDSIDEVYVLSKLRDNFYNLSLLKYIANELEEMKLNDNIVLISDFNKMIAQLLVDENANYVYERLGNRFNHYLLDEFQDTSRLQWMNLIPLLHNSLAQDYTNLIVGDPKQAIYRFRNGVVEQFVALPGIFNPEQSPKINAVSNYFKERGVNKTLDDNWRSRENIVRFNNDFFKLAIETLAADTKAYYADVKQHPRGAAGGYLRFDFFANEDDRFVVEEEFILRTIRACVADGFKRGDICLLARAGKDGNRWAKLLAKAPEKFKVVSEDSLNVSADKTVQVIIHYLRLRKNNANTTAQIRFASDFIAITGEDPIQCLSDYWKTKVGDLDFPQFIADYFESEEAFYFNYENLYDLGQQLSRLLHVNELNNPYLHHLMEMFHRYDEQYGPDLRGFMEQWEIDGYKETVQMPDNDEAIKIMTAHKAKGLEFPIVVLPNLAWEIKLKDSFFLDVGEGKVVHTKLTKNEETSPEFASKRYLDEVKKVFLDEFNLLYVAMTRPVHRLYGLVEANEKGVDKVGDIADDSYSKIPKMSQLVFGVLNHLPASPELMIDAEKMEYGTAEVHVEHSESEEVNNVFAANISDRLWFPEISFRDSASIEQEEVSEELRFGAQLHLVLENATKGEQLHRTIEKLYRQDRVEQRFVQHLLEKASKVMNFPPYQELFQAAETVYNEQDIISSEVGVFRPDILFAKGKTCTVLDYKTGIERREHHQQMQQYLAVLQEMGYTDLKGILFYTSEMRFVHCSR